MLAQVTTGTAADRPMIALTLALPQAGADLEALDAVWGRTALMWSVIEGRWQMCESLLDLKARRLNLTLTLIGCANPFSTSRRGEREIRPTHTSFGSGLGLGPGCQPLENRPET